MLDTVEVRRPTGGWTYVDGQDVRAYEALFTTRARIKAAGLVARDAEAGARTVVTVSRELHIPVDSPEVPDGAEVVVLTVDATSDPTLAGAVLRVVGPTPGSQTTARRLQVEQALT